MSNKIVKLPELPVHIDVERMEKALRGPSYLMPTGLTSEQRRQYMDTVSRAVNNAIMGERERCAKLAEDMDYGLGELAAAIRRG